MCVYFLIEFSYSETNINFKCAYSLMIFYLVTHLCMFSFISGFFNSNVVDLKV